MKEKDFCELSEKLSINIIIKGTNKSWAKIAHMAKLRSYSKGYLIEMHGENQQLYLIKEGYVCYSYYLPNGEKRILYYIGKNSLFNEAHCMLNIGDRVIFECMSDIKVYIFPSNMLKDPIFIQKYPDLYINFAQYIIFKRMYLGHFTSTIFKQKPITRIAEILLQLYLLGNDLKINKTDISNLLGLHPMTVARALSRLRHEKIIGKITKNNFEIFDLKRLESFTL